MITLQQNKTRIFQFPNGGHSVRKLCDSLYELGDTQVDIVMEAQHDQYGTMTDKDCQLYFVTNNENGKFNASMLANKFKTLGTRFQVVNDSPYYDGSPNYELKFHTDFDDILQYPEFYEVTAASS